MSHASSSRRQDLIAQAILCAVVALTFARALYAGFVWDDIPLIVHNRFIREMSFLWRNLTHSFWDVGWISEAALSSELANTYYRPLVTLSYMLDHQVYGLRPWGYHLSNIVMHLAAVLLAYAVSRRVVGREYRGLALIAVAFFALHPTRTEAVCWISGRTDVMMSVFFLAALLLFWRALSAGTRFGVQTISAWLCYLAAILCKEAAVALAVVVPATDFLLISKGDRQRMRSNVVWCHGPLVVATLAFVVVRVLHGSGAARGGLPLAARANALFSSVTHYGAMLLDAYHPTRMVGAYFNPHKVWLLGLSAGALITAGVVIAVVFCARRRYSVALWALVFFVASLAPASNLVPLGLTSLVAERFLYLPMLGVGVLVTLGIRAVVGRLRPLIVAAVVAVLVSWSATIVVRSGDYSNALRFWAAMAAATPNNPLAQQELARELVAKKAPKRAEIAMFAAFQNWRRVGKRNKLLESQLRLLNVRLLRIGEFDPDFLRRAGGFLETLASAGGAAGATSEGPGLAGLDLGRISLQVPLRDARDRKQVSEQLHIIYSMLGVVRSRLGEDRAAARALKAALDRQSDHLETRVNLVMAHARQLNLVAARKQLEIARSRAGDIPAIDRLDDLLRRVSPRIERLKAMQQVPESADQQRLLAEIYMILGAKRRAIQHWRRVITLRPQSRRAYATLAMELAQVGDLSAALTVLSQARALFGRVRALERLENEVRLAHSQAVATIK